MTAPHRVLFVESGEAGGGSFQSLVGILEVLDREKYTPMVAYVNDGPHVEIVRRKDLQIFLLEDRLYSRTSSDVFRTFLGRSSLALAAVNCSLHIAYLRWLHGPMILELSHLCRQNNVSLIYLNDQINRDFFGVLLARRIGRPVISHLRSLHGRGFCLQKAVMANDTVAAFAANSMSTRDYWVSLGLDGKKIWVVPNAVPEAEGPGIDPREELGLKRETKIIGCVGRLIELKGHAFLIRAFALLSHRIRDAVLLIVGDGPLLEELKSLTERLGVAERVVFMGRRDDARDMMAGMDVLVLPSRYEGSGRVLLEAMSQGTPVIGTDLYGIREIVDHGRNGFLVPYDDDVQLAELVGRILGDPGLAQRMGREGAEKAAREYSMKRHADSIRSVLESALS